MLTEWPAIVASSGAAPAEYGFIVAVVSAALLFVGAVAGLRGLFSKRAKLKRKLQRQSAEISKELDTFVHRTRSSENAESLESAVQHLDDLSELLKELNTSARGETNG